MGVLGKVNTYSGGTFGLVACCHSFLAGSALPADFLAASCGGDFSGGGRESPGGGIDGPGSGRRASPGTFTPSGLDSESECDRHGGCASCGASRNSAGIWRGPADLLVCFVCGGRPGPFCLADGKREGERESNTKLRAPLCSCFESDRPGHRSVLQDPSWSFEMSFSNKVISFAYSVFTANKGQ